VIGCYENYKDSRVEWVGEIPTGWEIKKIKYLAHGEGTLFLDGDWIESKDIVFDDSQIRYITTGNIGEGKYKEQGLTYITDETFKKLNCTEIFPGDLLISRLNPPIGRCCIVPDLGSRIVTSVDNVVLRPSSQYKKEFLKYVMSSPRYFEYTSLIARGATMQRISRGLLGDVELPVTADSSEQTAIATFLDRKTAEIDQLITNKEKLIALYEEEKTTIINRAVTRGLDPDVTTKPSGVDWIGDIPEDWEVKRFKYLGRFINGYSFNSSDFTTSGVRVMKISNIQTMKLDWSDESFVEESFYDKYETFRVQRNDLVFALTRPIISTGIKAAIVDTDEDILLNQRNSMFKASDEVHTKWMYYLILNNQFVQEFDKQIDKTGQQPNISSNDIAEISVPVPLLSEQIGIIEHIEAECSRLDSIIYKFEKQIELFKEYRTTLISEVVTGKIDVRGEVAA